MNFIETFFLRRYFILEKYLKDNAILNTKSGTFIRVRCWYRV